MPLHVVKPPDGTEDLACKYLAHMRADCGFQTRGTLANSMGKALWLAAPHPVFNLHFEDVGSSAMFESVHMSGWRFLVIAGDQAVATVELAGPNPTVAPRFSRVTDGRMAASAARIIGKAERNATVRRRTYFLGMVRVPEIHLNALWLRDDHRDGMHDLFSAVVRAPAGTPLEKLLSPTNFMAHLVREKRQLPKAGRTGEQA